jgi:hypothetical protein
MDEYTADPLQTEKEAQRVLRKMKIDNAKAEVGRIAEEARARRVDENTYKRLGEPVNRGGGGGGGMPKSSKHEPFKFAKGGTASSRGDGCAVRGKTKGRIV